VKIDVSALPKGGMADVSVSGNLAAPTGYFLLNSSVPVRFEGEITREGGVYTLAGKLRADTVSLQCDRCLKPLTLSLGANVREKFSRDTFSGYDDEDVWPFAGGEIDLSDALAVSFLQALPRKVLCREDCKGLCPVCGNDLNLRACGCDRTQADPRLAELTAFFSENKEV